MNNILATGIFKYKDIVLQHKADNYWDIFLNNQMIKPNAKKNCFQMLHLCDSIC